MKTNNSERRKHKRQKANGNLIIYNEKMYAEIVDISKGGLSCRTRVNPKKMFTPILDVEILDRVSGEFINGLSGIMVRCSELISQGDGKQETILNFGIEFKNMTDEKKVLLDKLINSCLISDAKIQDQNKNIVFN